MARDKKIGGRIVSFRLPDYQVAALASYKASFGIDASTVVRELIDYFIAVGKKEET